jgi:hypothetical protein
MPVFPRISINAIFSHCPLASSITASSSRQHSFKFNAYKPLKLLLTIYLTPFRAIWLPSEICNNLLRTISIKLTHFNDENPRKSHFFSWMKASYHLSYELTVYRLTSIWQLLRLQTPMSPLSYGLYQTSLTENDCIEPGPVSLREDYPTLFIKQTVICIHRSVLNVKALRFCHSKEISISRLLCVILNLGLKWELFTHKDVIFFHLFCSNSRKWLSSKYFLLTVLYSLLPFIFLNCNYLPTKIRRIS